MVMPSSSAGAGATYAWVTWWWRASGRVRTCWSSSAPSARRRAGGGYGPTTSSSPTTRARTAWPTWSAGWCSATGRVRVWSAGGTCSPAVDRYARHRRGATRPAPAASCRRLGRWSTLWSARAILTLYSPGRPPSATVCGFQADEEAPMVPAGSGDEVFDGDEVFERHRGGKLAVAATVRLDDADDLSLAYT